MAMNRRTFLTAAMGAGILASCASKSTLSRVTSDVGTQPTKDAATLIKLLENNAAVAPMPMIGSTPSPLYSDFAGAAAIGQTVYVGEIRDGVAEYARGVAVQAGLHVDVRAVPCTIASRDLQNAAYVLSEATNPKCIARIEPTYDRVVEGLAAELASTGTTTIGVRSLARRGNRYVADPGIEIIGNDLDPRSQTRVERFLSDLGYSVPVAINSGRADFAVTTSPQVLACMGR